MHKTALLAAVSTMAFTGTPKPAAAAPATADAPKVSKPRVAPDLTVATAAVPMPTRRGTRGSNSMYPFESLTEVGMSFGIKNKKAESMNAIVSNQNKKAMVDKRNPDGSLIYKMADVKDSNGVVVGSQPTSEAEKETGKHYFAVNVDPATDPDGASVRVFRDK